jgi:hypothetical protein
MPAYDISIVVAAGMIESYCHVQLIFAEIFSLFGSSRPLALFIASDMCDSQFFIGCQAMWSPYPPSALLRRPYQRLLCL